MSGRRGSRGSHSHTRTSNSVRGSRQGNHSGISRASPHETASSHSQPPRSSIAAGDRPGSRRGGRSGGNTFSYLNDSWASPDHTHFAHTEPTRRPSHTDTRPSGQSGSRQCGRTGQVISSYDTYSGPGDMCTQLLYSAPPPRSNNNGDRPDRNLQTDGKKCCPTCNQYFDSRGLASHMKSCKQRASLKQCPRCNDEFDPCEFHRHAQSCGRGASGNNFAASSIAGDQSSRPSSAHHVTPTPKMSVPYRVSTPTRSSYTRSDSTASLSSNFAQSCSIREKECTLTQDPIATNAINSFKEDFIKEMNKRGPIQWTAMPAGSYYDKTKISVPDEFDIIFFANIPANPEFETDEDSIGYCKLKAEHPDFIPEDFKAEKGYLCPRGFKQFAFKMFRDVITDASFRKGRRITVSQRPQDCPAFTIKYKPGGPRELDIDLVPAIRMEGWPKLPGCSRWRPKWTDQNLNALQKEYEVVAKYHGNGPLWRMSFTNASKMLWMHADGGKRENPTCRKSVLKQLKLILETFKKSNPDCKICSHHLRNAMLLMFDKYPRDNQWKKTKAEKVACIERAMEELQTFLRKRRLDNYFVKGYNLLRNVPDAHIRAFQQYLADNLPR